MQFVHERYITFVDVMNRAMKGQAVVLSEASCKGYLTLIPQLLMLRLDLNLIV